MLGKVRLLISLERREKKTTRAVVYQWLWQEAIPSARRCFGTWDICIQQPRLVSVCGGDFDTNTWRVPSRTLEPTLLPTGARGNKRGVTGSAIYSLTGGGAAQHVRCHLTPSDLVPTEAWWAGADQSWRIWGSEAPVHPSGGEAEERRPAIRTAVFALEESPAVLTRVEIASLPGSPLQPASSLWNGTLAAIRTPKYIFETGHFKMSVLLLSKLAKSTLSETRLQRCLT